jgi:DNA-binding response OmpR family regulator
MSERLSILLVDDDHDIVRALGIRLKAAGYDITAAYDGLTGLAAAQTNQPNAIILDIRMPGMDGLTVLARLREQDCTRRIPVLILTANVVEAVRSKAMGLGAYCFLKKPCDPSDLLNAIQGAMSQTDQNTSGDAPITLGKLQMQPQKTILLADDNQDFLLPLRRRFQDLGIRVICARDGLDVLMLVTTEAPDLIILDIGMPSADGLKICEKLSQNVSTSAIPVIILTGRSDEETRQRCKALGARYIHKNLMYWNDLKTVVCDYLNVEAVPADQRNLRREVFQQVPAEPSVPKILVIDDDPHITQALMIRLNALGFDVIRAPDAMGGTYLAWTESPDLIITDQNMPGMSGENLMVILKSDEETKKIPVIVITGQTVNGS